MTTLSPISRRIRNVQRYVRVLEILAYHGFAEIVQHIGLDGLIDRGRSIIGAAPRATDGQTPLCERVRKALEDLGPTFVKLGQVLSTRPDLIPPDWAEEFKRLQDDVPGVDYELIHTTLKAEFPGKLTRLFRSIQKKPLAAASMAQVHRARLHDGARIVLKVLRPGIREVVAADMDILRTLAELAESHFSNLGYSPTEVVTEFTKELAKEMDLTHEGRSTERLRGFFDEDPEIIFPKVYWEATTKSVLALEEIRGDLLSRIEDGEVGTADRKRLVVNGARAVLRQCLEFGFFHADPHPGNLIALKGGRIAFIDCGMTGQLDTQTTHQLADLVTGVVTGDIERVVAVVGGLGNAPPDKLDDRAFRSDVQAIVSEFQDTALGQLNLGNLLQKFFGALRAHKIRCPADLILLIKALTTIESVASTLDPDFDMVEFARPHIENLVHKRHSVAAIRSRVQRTLLQYAELAESLPANLRPLLAQLRLNKLNVNLEHRGLDRLTHTIEHASRNIAFALIIAALTIGSSILVLASENRGLAAIGISGFIAAAVLAFLMIVANRKYHDG